MRVDELRNTMKREVRRLTSRRIYLFTMVLIPIGFTLFFLSLLGEGLPLKVPTAVVDRDNSKMSREMVRSLGASELIDIKYQATDFQNAMDMVKSGEIFGFFLVPDNFERDALSGRPTTVAYYSNMAFFIPGTLSFKGFKTIAVSTSGSIVKTTLVSTGADEAQVGALLQPMVMQDHPMGNPWASYSIYLGNSFIPGVIALMVLLTTAFSICSEIKNGSSIKWINGAGGSMTIAIVGKLLPQTVIFSIVGVAIQSILYGYYHFPLHCNAGIMILAMVLLVIACQAMALIFCCIIPNLRLALSVVSLVGILSFSVTGFSFPLEDMYGAIAVFGYIIPLRYYFLIYVDQALNGIALYYSRWYFISLLLFPLIASLLLWRLKRACLKPVYIP